MNYYNIEDMTGEGLEYWLGIDSEGIDYVKAVFMDGYFVGNIARGLDDTMVLQ